MFSATLTTKSLATVRRLEELTVTERVIRDYILNLDGCDAISFTAKQDVSLMMVPCLYQDGEYAATAYVPRVWDADDTNGDDTIATALMDYAPAGEYSAVIAIDPDDSNVLLCYPVS